MIAKASVSVRVESIIVDVVGIGSRRPLRQKRLSKAQAELQRNFQLRDGPFSSLPVRSFRVVYSHRSTVLQVLRRGRAVNGLNGGNNQCVVPPIVLADPHALNVAIS